MVLGFSAGVSNFLGLNDEVRNSILPDWPWSPVLAHTAYTFVISVVEEVIAKEAE